MENTEVKQEKEEITVSDFNYEEDLKRKKDQILLNQNYPFGLIAGIIAGIIGAILWAVITVATEYQIGYMAIAIGLLVGFSIRLTGKGIQPIFGITGAIISLLSCVLGNILSLIGFYAKEEALSFFTVLPYIDFSAIPGVMAETFNPIDLLFYGIAIYEGYRFSIINPE